VIELGSQDQQTYFRMELTVKMANYLQIKIMELKIEGKATAKLLHRWEDIDRVGDPLVSELRH